MVGGGICVVAMWVWVEDGLMMRMVSSVDFIGGMESSCDDDHEICG
jgi:hypothetical protein